MHYKTYRAAVCDRGNRMATNSAENDSLSDGRNAQRVPVEAPRARLATQALECLAGAAETAAQREDEEKWAYDRLGRCYRSALLARSAPGRQQ